MNGIPFVIVMFIIIIIIIINVYFRPTTENSEGPYSKYIMITYRYIIQTKVSVT